MTTSTISSLMETLAKNLTKEFPRSPREKLAGYILAARILDKCRAFLNNTNGEYNYNCPLDKIFFDFTGINPDEFKAFVATGASDEQVGDWIQTHSKQKDRADIVKWNNKYRDLRLSDLPLETQLFMEDYIDQNVPKGRPVYHWFDVFDLEEKRL